MKTLTPSATIDTATFQVPEDAVDAQTAASLEPAFQKCVNSTLALKNGIYRKIYCSVVRLGSADWRDHELGVGSMGGQFVLAQTVAAAAAEWCQFSIDLPVGAVITSYGMRLLPTVGHAALPAGKPQIVMNQWDQDLGSGVTVGGTGAIDGSANVAAYEQYHTVEKTGFTHTVIADRQYFIAVSGESGANRIDDLYYSAVWAVVVAP
jgi:hypothetical protein